MPDHVHMLLNVSPKYAVSKLVCYIKGKSAIHVARTYGGRQHNFVGQHFLARGYHVSTVGGDEEVLRKYIRDQDQEDKCLEQLEMFNRA